MSTLKVNTIQDTSGNTQYTAKAWVTFKGDGTVTIHASGNVSSVGDNGTGDYTVNFSSSMSDAYYAVSGTSQPIDSHGANHGRTISVYRDQATTSYVRIMNAGLASSTDIVDGKKIYCVIHR